MKCILVLARSWLYGINTECDALDKYEKLVMKSSIVEPVFVTPWQIHLLFIWIQESTPSTNIIQMSIIFVANAHAVPE